MGAGTSAEEFFFKEHLMLKVYFEFCRKNRLFVSL